MTYVEVLNLKNWEYCEIFLAARLICGQFPTDLLACFPKLIFAFKKIEEPPLTNFESSFHTKFFLLDTTNNQVTKFSQSFFMSP